MSCTLRLTFVLTLLIAAQPVAAQSRETERQRAALALHSREAALATATDSVVAQRAQRPFRHAQHRSVECGACHDMRAGHGRVTITSPGGCQSCHHRGATSETCSRCHEASQYGARPYPQTARITVAGNERGRNLPFDHTGHAAIACAECHRPAAPAGAASASCAGCHEDHHEVTRNCITCHEAPARDVHDVNVHVTCTGSGCHEAAFLSGEPRTRQTCLACHRDQADHRPGETCADCHALPPFRGRTPGAGRP